MVNGEHEKLDFDYDVDGEVFSRLFYLVNGIYFSLSRFILSESDPHTKIAYSFAADQEAHRKDVERGFWCSQNQVSGIDSPYQSLSS